MEKFTFSKEDTKIMKGFAIALMLIHHLAFRDRIADNLIPISFTMAGGMDTADYIGRFGKICVSIFYFCGGIGVYKAYKDGKLDIFNRILRLYISYWKVFLIFVPLGFLLFSAQPDYCANTGICHRFENFSEIELAANFTGIQSTYNSEWYFLKEYVVILITFWCGGGYFISRHTFGQNVFAIMVYDIVLEAVVPALPETAVFKYLPGNYLFQTFISQLVPYAACFWMGCAAAKDDILEKLRFELHNQKMLHIAVDAVVIICAVIIRTSIIGASIDMFLVPALAVFVPDFVRRARGDKIFIAVGKRSTNMWLTHTFFCYYFYAAAKFVLKPRYAVLVWLLLMVLSYTASVLIDKLYEMIGMLRKKYKCRFLGERKMLMFKIEKKFLDWIENHFTVLVIVFGTILSMLVRAAFRHVVSGDYTSFLEGWYNEIYVGGGIRALGRQVGNYNFLYQMCIAIMTYVPVSPLYAYKILSIAFDYLLAAAAAIVVSLVSGGKKNHAIAAYFAVLFSPIVILNSSAWAQCDAIYVFWAVAAVYALLKEKYFAAFILLGMSFSFKLQAVFILPFFLFIYFVKRKFSILNFIAIPFTMIVTGLPALFFGRSIFDIFFVYFQQADRYKQAALNYPSFWTIFFEPGSTDYYASQKPAAIFLTIAVLAAFMIWWINRKVELSNKNMIYMAFILSYTCVLFMPQMHERYGYLYEILAIIVLFINPQTIKFMLPLYVITLTTYGKFLFGLPHPVDVYTGIANTFVWFGYVVLILKDMCRQEKTSGWRMEEG